MPDPLQDRVASYVLGLSPGALGPAARDAATLRVVDTVASLFGGLDAPPAVQARALAARRFPGESAILGTRQQTTADMAAFANATAARCAEMNDTYHRAGKPGAHPSDVIMPLFGVAEMARGTGEELLVAIVGAYEVFLRIADATNLSQFDYTLLAGLGVAVGAGRLLRLDLDQMLSCISIAVVGSNPLRRSRLGRISMWKSAASGHAGRAGVFAALLAEAGLQGPFEPFSGPAGWLETIVGGHIDLGAMGGDGEPFKVGDTILKPRAVCGTAIPAVLAAERAYVQTGGSLAIAGVVVETYRDARDKLASGPHHWDPRTPESADHSIPYVVAATLADGTAGPAQFDEAHLNSPRIREILGKVKVVERKDFTADYDSPACLHRTRVTVTMANGDVFAGETGGEFGDISDAMSTREVDEKFGSAVSGRLSAARAAELLDALWHLDKAPSVPEIVRLMTP
jgi:2-methylcitrate dehydratase